MLQKDDEPAQAHPRFLVSFRELRLTSPRCEVGHNTNEGVRKAGGLYLYEEDTDRVDKLFVREKEDEPSATCHKRRRTTITNEVPSILLNIYFTITRDNDTN